MYCARPVVGANAGGVPEEIIDWETGILYPPGDDKRLANAISFLLDNPEIGRSMGRAGKKRVTQFFNKEILCKKIEHVYESI
jgi:glycosyltransferase involved in cell wall biosynthesis